MNNFPPGPNAFSFEGNSYPYTLPGIYHVGRGLNMIVSPDYNNPGRVTIQMSDTRRRMIWNKSKYYYGKFLFDWFVYEGKSGWTEKDKQALAYYLGKDKIEAWPR